MEGYEMQQPQVSSSPNTLFNKRLRISLSHDRTLAVEFWPPTTPDGEIDLAVVLEHDGAEDPEDLVVIRAENNRLELYVPKD